MRLPELKRGDPGLHAAEFPERQHSWAAWHRENCRLSLEQGEAGHVRDAHSKQISRRVLFLAEPTARLMAGRAAGSTGLYMLGTGFGHVGWWAHLGFWSGVHCQEQHLQGRGRASRPAVCCN